MNCNSESQLKDMLDTDEVFELLVDIFKDPCKTTLSTSSHFKAIDVAEDLSVEEDRGMKENLISERIIEECQERLSFDGSQLKNSSLDEELLTLSNTLMKYKRNHQLGDMLLCCCYFIEGT